MAPQRGQDTHSILTGISHEHTAQPAGNSGPYMSPSHKCHSRDRPSFIGDRDLASPDFFLPSAVVPGTVVGGAVRRQAIGSCRRGGTCNCSTAREESTKSRSSSTETSGKGSSSSIGRADEGSEVKCLPPSDAIARYPFSRHFSTFSPAFLSCGAGSDAAPSPTSSDASWVTRENTALRPRRAALGAEESSGGGTNLDLRHA